MGRTITSSKSNFSPNSTFSLSFLLAGIAASIAIIFALCISYHRKSSSKSQPTSPSSNESSKKTNIPSIDVNVKPSLSPPPPPPPPKTEVQEECTKPTLSTSSPPRRKLSVSLSMRLPEGLSKIRASTKDKGMQKVPQSADESSVWMKTIILGERCKIPSSDDEDEVTVYDDKGNKHRNYHPRTPRSLPVSRTNSFANAEPIAS